MKDHRTFGTIPYTSELATVLTPQDAHSVLAIRQKARGKNGCMLKAPSAVNGGATHHHLSEICMGQIWSAVLRFLVFGRGFAPLYFTPENAAPIHVEQGSGRFPRKFLENSREISRGVSRGIQKISKK